MVSEAGTVRLLELELRPIVPPPVPLRVTVHVLEVLWANVPGLQAIELIEVVTAPTLTVPPVPVTARASPVGEAPILLMIVTGRELVPDGVTDTVAMTPLEMALEVNPHATHV
jgi:hypothetical protein